MGGALFDESPGSVADEVGVLRQATFVRGGKVAGPGGGADPAGLAGRGGAFSCAGALRGGGVLAAPVIARFALP